MRVLVLSVLLMLGLGLRPGLANEQEIEAVITAQIDAFKVDDFETAFTFAHPNIRRLFGTPQNFGVMVRRGYPMVWRPAEVLYLDQYARQDGVAQIVRITDAQGRAFHLEYAMVQTPQGWRINGVRFLEQDDLAA